MAMRKMLLDFSVWAFCLGLLLIIWILGLNGHRGWAAIVMVIVVATMLFWVKISPIPNSHPGTQGLFTRKTLWDFLIFVFELGLLIIAGTLGQNGYRGWAAVVIVFMVAIMLLWNKIGPNANSQTTLWVLPEERKTIVRRLGSVSFVLGVFGIAIGAGIFGRSQFLAQMFLALCVIGGAITLIIFSMHNKIK
jgi:hypothetical protein